MFKFDPSTNSIDNYVSKITNVDSALKNLNKNRDVQIGAHK